MRIPICPDPIPRQSIPAVLRSHNLCFYPLPHFETDKYSILLYFFRFPDKESLSSEDEYNQAKKADEIGEAIERQLQKDRLEIKYNPKDYFNPKKKKKMIDLNTLGE